tara:strand:- start:5677 stop:6195 length:519 start_codon:yes stop_codon:yes gene_type:complete
MANRKTKPPNFRDRIKELRRVPASELRANPKNWRVHPTAQVAAMKGVLAEIGFANAVIARETPGGLELIDGHLRQEIMGDQLVPVLVVDVTGAEADKLLLTLDPLASLADADADRLHALLEGVTFKDKAVLEMLAGLDGVVPDFQPVGVEDQSRLDEKSKVICPNCGNEFAP